jgi:hypothetical protein
MTKTAESTASFRKTPQGEPIEFVDYSFAITREEWLRRIIREEMRQASS